MPTKLFLRSTLDKYTSQINKFCQMLTTAGSGTTTAVVNTAASGTEIQWTDTAGGQTIQWISGFANSSFTLTQSDISIWAQESNMNANIGGRYRIFRRAFGSEVDTEIGGGPFNDGVEFGTSAAEMTWIGNNTDQAFNVNDRIVVKIYITNVGTMASGHTGTLTYNGSDGGTGDSFLNIAETVTFTEEPVANLEQQAFRFYEDGTENGATAIDTQNTDIVRDLDGGDSLLAVRVRVQNTTNGTYFRKPHYLRASINSGAYNLVQTVGDSYKATYNSSVTLAQAVGQTSSNERIGQSFTGKGGTLEKIKLKLFRAGTPSDNWYVEIYAHSGTYGTNGVPTGSALATSDNVNISAISTSTLGQEVDFTFSGGNQISLTNDTKYFWVLRRSGAVNGTNYGGSIYQSVGQANPNFSHSGNGAIYNASWSSQSDAEYPFFIVESPTTAVMIDDSANLTEGQNTTNILTGGTGSFVTGGVSDAGGIHYRNMAVGTNYTDFLFPIVLKASLLNNNDTIDFRVYYGDDAYTTYTETPRITISKTFVAPTVRSLGLLGVG